MLSREKLLHPATIIATVALMVALSGAAFAAATIGTAQIKNGAVTKAKLASSSVTGPKIAGGAVHGQDLARGAVTSGKLASGAVGAPALANGAVTQSKLAPNAVTGATLSNGSVTNEKLGPNAVTGAKIAGSTITAANIQNGQVVKGNGFFLSAREVLPTGAGATTILTLTNIGLVQASCNTSPGVATVSFTNQSGTTVDFTASGVNDAGTDAAFIEQATPANGVTTPVTASGGGTQAMDLQASYTDATNTVHVATASVSVAAAGSSCVVTAQATTTN
jgi:hypothetical protein